MYFIITGFFLNRIRFKTFLVKRFKRLLVPYIFYGLSLNFLLFVYLYLKNNISASLISERITGLLYSRYSLLPLGTEDNIYFLGICSPMWFLTALFVASVLAIPFFYANSKQEKLLICFYAAVTFLLNGVPILLPWSLDTAFIGALFINFGCKYKMHINPPKKYTQNTFVCYL